MEQLLLDNNQLIEQLLEIELKREEERLLQQEQQVLDQELEEEESLAQNEKELADLQFREDLLTALTDIKNTTELTYTAITTQQEFLSENYSREMSYLDNNIAWFQWAAVIVVVVGVAYPAIWVVKQISQFIRSAFRIY